MDSKSISPSPQPVSNISSSSAKSSSLSSSTTSSLPSSSATSSSPPSSLSTSATKSVLCDCSIVSSTPEDHPNPTSVSETGLSGKTTGETDCGSTKDNSELKKMLADELKRRREFSERLLRHFNGTDLDGAKEMELIQEMQSLDGIVYSMIDKCCIKQSQGVDRRQKEEISARRDADSGIVQSEEDHRRYGVRISNLPARNSEDLGLPEILSSSHSMPSEIQGLAVDHSHTH